MNCCTVPMVSGIRITVLSNTTEQHRACCLNEPPPKVWPSNLVVDMVMRITYNGGNKRVSFPMSLTGTGT